MATFSLGREMLSTSLEKSLLEDYRNLILYPNNVNAPIQHPQYSFYYAEFCRLNDQMYNKRGLEGNDEKEFDVKVRKYFLEAEANLITNVSNLIRESLCKDDADVGKLIGALIIMEIYVRNLISMPQKKEFHTILTYSGIYKIWIEPHLLGTDWMFHQFGYRRTENGDRFVLSEHLPKVNLEVTAMCFRLASVMCFIIYFAQKRMPEASLSMVFEIAKRTPIGENELIPIIKKQLLPKHKPSSGDNNNLTTKPETKIVANSNTVLGEMVGAFADKRDKEIPRGPTAGEEETKIPHSTISLRHKSLDLKNFIIPTQHKQDEKVNRGARSKEFEYAFEEVSQPTSYGFSQPFGKGLSMRLSPGFDPIVDEEEDEDESNRSPFSKPAKDRSKGKRDARAITFSTFKRQSPSNVMGLAGHRDIVPSIHQHTQTVRQVKDDFDENSFLEIVSTQLKSEDSLENFFKTRTEDGRNLGTFE